MALILSELLRSEQFKELRELEFEELVWYVKQVEEKTLKNINEKVDFRSLI